MNFGVPWPLFEWPCFTRRSQHAHAKPWAWNPPIREESYETGSEPAAQARVFAPLPLARAAGSKHCSRRDAWRWCDAPVEEAGALPQAPRQINLDGMFRKVALAITTLCL